MENNTDGNIGNGDSMLEREQVVDLDKSLMDFFLFFNYVTFGQVVNVFGMVTNVLSLVVFLKMRFKETVNISLFALTVSDLCSLVMLFFFNICQIPSLGATLNLPFDPYDLAFMTVSWSHIAFTRVTCYLTAFIALERCLCILAPLKVKSILTPHRTAWIVCATFPVMCTSVMPVYFGASLAWRFSPVRNRTLLVMTHSHKRLMMESITSIVNSVVPLVAFVIIVCCTALTVVQLRQKISWRQECVQAGQKNRISERDRKVGVMIVLISSVFIVCYLPSEVVFVWQFIDLELDYDGKRRNLFNVLISFLYLFETINASVNIFIYLVMSSKYKGTLMAMFCRRKVKM